MTAHPTPLGPAAPAPVRARRIRDALLHVLTDVLAAPKGDLGGWEGGARGL
jgi:hypothetical protein